MKNKKHVSYHGGIPYSSLKQTARELRKNQTLPEKIFWEKVRNRKFLNLKFRRQHQIRNYIVDFFCNELKLVIEFDGELHLNEDQVISDRYRDEELAALGFKVLRFSNSDIINNSEVVFDKIETLIPRPLLPLGEGEKDEFEI